MPGLQILDILFQDGEILPDGSAVGSCPGFFRPLLLKSPVDLRPGLLPPGNLGIQKGGFFFQFLG